MQQNITRWFVHFSAWEVFSEAKRDSKWTKERIRLYYVKIEVLNNTDYSVNRSINLLVCVTAPVGPLAVNRHINPNGK
jgi:hypothetical protein